MTLLGAAGRLRVVALLLGLAAMAPAPGRAQVAEIRAGVAKILVITPASKTGAGIIVGQDADGADIVTAAHVVSGADKIVVQFFGLARSWPAEVRNIEHENVTQGLALLRVAGPLPAEVRALPLAVEVTAAALAQVSVIGHQSATGDWGVLAGIVSGRKGRELIIQAPIQEQTSGGPVILGGRVVGLVQRKDPSGAFGYAITAQAIREYAQGLQVALAPSPSRVPAPVEPTPQPVITPAPAPKPPPVETRQIVTQEPKPLRAPYRAGDVFQECRECPEMVVIPPGEFTMGSPLSEAGRKKDEGPQHKVTLARPFAVGKYEVTFDEWDACVAAGGCAHKPDDHGWGRDRRPVVNVNWEDAQAYVSWLSKRTGKPYRLLSEAEWEYAARAGTTTRYPWGDTLGTNRANSADSGSHWSGKQTAPASSFDANQFGLHDMIANVWEWVQDCLNESYWGAPADGRAWESDGCARRVVRGGAWNRLPEVVRAANRGRTEPDHRNYAIGFRVARTL